MKVLNNEIAGFQIIMEVKSITSCTENHVDAPVHRLDWRDEG
jgi:hypothetical protein